MKILKDEVGETRTARLLLRPLRIDDAVPLFALFNNWHIVRFLSSPPWPYRPADAERYIRGAIGHAPGFVEDPRAITREGALIGIISVRMRTAQRGGGPSVGYWLGQPFWGQGFMSEAARAFVHILFQGVGTDAVCSGAFADNAASLRVQEKIGFLRDGTSTLFSVPRNADFPHVDTVLTRDRFERLGPPPG